MEKFCSNCGNEIKENDIYCLNCGVLVQNNNFNQNNLSNDYNTNKNIPGKGISIAGMILGIISIVIALISFL